MMKSSIKIFVFSLILCFGGGLMNTWAAGVCGSANGGTFVNAPINNLCSTGTAIMLDKSYSKIKSITVSNSSGSALTDYQVSITVPYDSDMNANFSDLRFLSSDGQTQLSYWIESKTDSSTAKVWVKVPSIPTTGAIIYMYYGNSSATSASNGDNTFILFDHFDGSTIDTSKWTSIITGSGGTYTISGSVLNMTKSSDANFTYYRSINTYSSGTMVEAYQKYNNTGQLSFASFYTMGRRGSNDWGAVSYDTSWNILGNTAMSYTSNTWARTGIAMRSSDSNARYYLNSTNVITHTRAMNSGFYSQFGPWYMTGTISIDWIFIRKVMAVEPTAAISATEVSIGDLPNGTWEWYCADGATIGEKCAANQGTLACGSASGSSFDSIPTTNLCNFGTAITFDADYSKVKSITVSNSSGSILTDYPFLMTVPYDSDMNADFSDLRFLSSDGQTQLSYWIESKTDSSTAKVWVKVPSIPIGGTAIYMYYGNPSATTLSNGNNVFTFFDDFTGTTIDTSKWTEVDASNYITQNGSLIVSNGTGTWGGTGIYTNTNFSRVGSVIEGKYLATCAVGTSYKDATMVWMKNTSTSVNYSEFTNAFYAQNNGSAYIWTNYEGTTNYTPNGTLVCNTQYKFRQIVKAAGGATTQYSSDDGNTWTTARDSSYYSGTFKVGVTHYQGGLVYIDNVIVRPYVSSEPTATISATEVSIGDLPNGTWEWHCVDGSTIGPKCAADQATAGCGSVDGTNIYSLTDTSDNLCATGLFLVWSGLTDNVYNWTCGGISCSANRKIDGVCGTNGKTYINETSYSGTFCSVGVSDPVTPNFPNQGSSETWTCSETNGGNPATCTASKTNIGAINFETPMDISAIGLSDTQKEQCLWCDNYYADTNPANETILAKGYAGSNLSFQFTYANVDAVDMTGYEFVLSSESVSNPDEIIDTSKKIVIVKDAFYSPGDTITVPGFSVSRNGFDSGIIVGLNSSKKQLAYGISYNWWVKIKTASGNSDWISSGNPFTTTSHQWPKVAIKTISAEAIRSGTTRYCSTAFPVKDEVTDPCLGVCWKQDNTSAGVTNVAFSFTDSVLQSLQLQSSAWKCSVCYDASGNAILCQNANTTLESGEYRFEWAKGGTTENIIFPSSVTEPALKPFETEDVNNGIYASNPFITVVVPSSTNKVKLKIRGSQCPLMANLNSQTIRPNWIEK